MKVAILGAGNIAGVVAATLSKLDEITCYAVAARDLHRAEQFAQTYGFQKAYGSYEEMVRDPEVELVYIATPHSHHFEHAMLCLEAGKHVLCEKTFTLNTQQARQVIACAREKGVYLAEAIWTRYMPARTMLNQILDSGVIGSCRMMTATLAYPNYVRERILRPELAGGALLDLGVYGLNFALMYFGDDIVRMDSSVVMTETGVDGAESITLTYRDGRMAVLSHSIFGRSDRQGILYGEKGYIVVDCINNPQHIRVYDTADQLLADHEVPSKISGYEYEFLEAARCIRAGKTESDSMPLAETIQVMEMMDQLRAKWGLIYPQET